MEEEREQIKKGNRKREVKEEEKNGRGMRRVYVNLKGEGNEKGGGREMIKMDKEGKMKMRYG